MTLQRGGMLHDIGKIGIPEAILGKPGKLTHEEFAVMRQHPVKGVEICQPLRSRLVALTLPIIRHHHERIDGRGYPDGLRGEEIPLLARIIAISDAYDAMTTDRPYRQGMPKTVALGLLLQGAGSQWDRALVERFVLMERQSPGRR
jgi:HD-GYP domain-containing protein (c-di-GMP phosphodiesterase class II)